MKSKERERKFFLIKKKSGKINLNLEMILNFAYYNEENVCVQGDKKVRSFRKG